MMFETFKKQYHINFVYSFEDLIFLFIQMKDLIYFEIYTGCSTLVSHRIVREILHYQRILYQARNSQSSHHLLLIRGYSQLRLVLK